MPGLQGLGGGGIFCDQFYFIESQSFPRYFNFSTHIFNWYLSKVRKTLVDNSRVEPTVFIMEKISFSLKLFFGHFYEQSFIKTVRGPLDI